MQLWTIAELGFSRALESHLGAVLKPAVLALGGLFVLAACSTIEPTLPKPTQPGEYEQVGPVGPPAPNFETSSAENTSSARERASTRRGNTDRPAAQTRSNRLPYSGGAYFENDGPGENAPANIDAIPDAKPRKEALASWANRPYTLFGRQYVPEREIKPFKQQGVASWYGRKFHGAKTANGERYDMYAMTAAHPTLPLPSYARVTNARTGQSVVVRVNDRGPFLNNRVIDLSYTAAHKLGYLEKGFAEVVVEQIAFDDSTDRLPIAESPGQSGRERMASDERASPLQSPMVRTAVKGRSENGLTELSSRFEMQAATPPSTEPAIADADAPDRGRSQPTSGNPVIEKSAGRSQSQPMDKLSSRPPVYLQMGAFQNRTNAIWAMAWVEEHLDTMAGTLEIYETDGWFKVQVGPFVSRSYALALQEHIRLATDFTPFLAVRAASP